MVSVADNKIIGAILNRMGYNFGNWVIKIIDRVREVGPQARLKNNSTEMAHKRSPHSSAS